MEPLEWLIWSEEHAAWWRPASHGYTDRIVEAGLYTKTEADRIVGNANYGDPTRPRTKFNEVAIQAPPVLLEKE